MSDVLRSLLVPGRPLLSPGALIALLAACGGDESGGPDGDEASGIDTGMSDAGDAGVDGSGGGRPDPDGDGPLQWLDMEYELHPSTRVVENAMLDSLTEVTDARLVFEPGAWSPGEIAPGSVLISGMSDAAPHGFMRRVLAVDEGDDVWLVETGQASLGQALLRLDLDMGGNFPSALLADAQNKDSIGGTLPFPLGGPVDWLVFDGDGDPSTTEDNIRIHGDVEATIAFTFRLHFDMSGLDSIDLTEFPPDINPTDIDLRVSLEIELLVGADVTAEGQASVSFSHSVPFGTIPLPPIGVWPLVFVPVLDAEGSIGGGATGSFSVRTGFEGRLAGSVGYSAGSGPSNSVQPPSWEPITPSADGEIRANLRAEVELELALLLAGIIGPKAGLELWAEVNADTARQPCWRADVGLNALVGLVIELFSVELVDQEWSWPIAAVEVASGSCPVGEAFEPPDSWSVMLQTAVFRVPSPDVASSWLSRAIDGRILLAGRASEGLYKLTSAGELVWARAFRTRDEVLDSLLSVSTATQRLDTGILATTDRDILLRLDAAGVLERADRLSVGNAEFLEFNGAARAADGSILLTSPLRWVDGEPRDMAVLRVLPDGTVSGWSWGEPDWDDTAWQILPWGDGFAVVGNSWNTSATPTRVSWVLRLDEAGTLQQSWRLQPCSGDDGLGLRAGAVTDDGDLVLAGWQRFSAPRATLVRMDATGAVAWTTLNRTTNLLGYDVTSITQLDGGAWLVSGTRWFAAPDDAFIARTDSAGRFIWVRRLGGSAAESGPAVLDNGDGSVTLAIPSDSLGPDEFDSGWWVSLLDTRYGDLALNSGLPVAITDDEFVAEDGCTATTAGPIQTTALQVEISLADVEPEPAPAIWSRVGSGIP